ncbi:MAG: hypothetical protein CMH27_00430 [Micavibrio sp.]|nr:hypothetical protein [Micavibrio sp.]|tara:strand:- start:848 stop:1054 length:207 start_codon:yes stop_codon:yes gene_type:complete
MLKLSEKTFKDMDTLVHATFAPAAVSAKTSYAMAANDHAGITDRFSLSARPPAPANMSAPNLQFATPA